MTIERAAQSENSGWANTPPNRQGPMAVAGLDLKRRCCGLARWFVVGWLGASGLSMACGQNPLPTAPSIVATVVELEGKAEFMAGARPPWAPLAVGGKISPGDRVRVLSESRLVLQLAGQSTVRFSPGADFTFERPAQARKPTLTLLRGLLYLFHRDEPVDATFQTRTVSAAVRGTEFVLEARDDGGAVLTLVDGEVDLWNRQGSLSLRSGEQGVAAAGQAPARMPVINAIRSVQWCLYYPAVLDPDELALTTSDRAVADASLAAYRAGSLQAALALLPPEHFRDSPGLRVFGAALLLAVGDIAQTEQLLAELPGEGTGEEAERYHRLAGALRLLMAAVKLETEQEPAAPGLASEWLALSYYQQAQAHLENALAAARAAVERAPNFGFGWARVATLEFSFGRTRLAHEALDRALRLAPGHAEAMALRGFVLSAKNQIGAALRQFDEALAMDGAVGQAWLGRGLCRIRRGDVEGGRQDIQVAATLEPQRALFRSYLSKAYSERGDLERAEQEIRLGQQLDPRDPTAWLYAGLLAQQENRINEAMGDLEESKRLNENRRVYRSRLLLDQDRAVRGANLASVYQDAGMEDVAVREAARAVTSDYANASAHLFLANSFNQLRDPRQVNLRIETAWFSEFLLANLLAPVGAGRLAQSISQNEYSKLFERDRLGIVSSTEYFSNGEWYETAVQHGTFGNTSYALEGFYHSSPGWRPESDLRQRALNLRVKQQLTAQDSLFGQIGYYDADYEDVNQYYRPEEAIRGFRAHETQEPNALLGHHHEWNPGNHTLLLAGRVDDGIELLNPLQELPWLVRNSANDVILATPLVTTNRYRSVAEIYTGELQHIWQHGAHSMEIGGRIQAGDFRTRSAQSQFSDPQVPVFPEALSQSDFSRQSVYAYHQWQIFTPLALVAGLSYDRVEYPVNFRFPPLTNRTDITDQLSPKGGFIWTPATDTAVRGAYSSSLGGVSLDQSYRLEPSQVAGFNQAYRSVIPEAVAGPNAVPTIEAWDLSLEQKLGRATYLGVAGEHLRSEVARRIGAITFGPLGSGGPIVPAGFYTADTPQRLSYQESSLDVSAYQLTGDWTFGARYRVSRAELEANFPAIPDAAAALGGLSKRQDVRSTLQQVRLFTVWNHPSGFFGLTEALWNTQANGGYSGTRPGDNFWQFNVFVGYRLAQRRVEIRLGLLNLNDQDYRLNPLNVTAELPRERTFTTALRFGF